MPAAFGLLDNVSSRYYRDLSKRPPANDRDGTRAVRSAFVRVRFAALIIEVRRKNMSFLSIRNYTTPDT